MATQVADATIKLSADASGVAGAMAQVRADARRTGDSVGKAMVQGSKDAARGLDAYIAKLQQSAAQVGKTAKEIKLMELAQRGATQAQLAAADAALRTIESAKAQAAAQRAVAASQTTAAAAAAAQARASQTASTAMLTTRLYATLAVAGFTALSKALLHSLDNLNDVSDATGASIENISALQKIAGSTGTKFESVTAALQKLNQSLNAAEPDSGVEKALKAIGLTVAELKALDPAEALQRVAQALSQFASDGNSARVVAELFGKQVLATGPFLKDLAEAGKLQATVTTQQAKEAEKLNNTFGALQQNALDLGRFYLSNLLPAINAINEAYAKARANKTGWFASMNDLAAQEEARLKERAKGIGPFPNVAGGGRGTVNPPAVLPSVGDFQTPKEKKSPKERDTSRQDARSALLLQLEDAKGIGDAIVQAFENQEKVLDAEKAAALVSDRRYYTQKQALAAQALAAKVDEVDTEIAILAKEKLEGADAVNRDREVAKRRAEIAKLQAAASTQVQTAAIAETARVEALRRTYANAAIAAKDYIDAINRADGREVAGLGRGDKARDDIAARGRIEDTFLAEKSRLEEQLRLAGGDQATDDAKEQFATYLRIAQDTYAAEVSAYEARTAAINRSQASWLDGATRALENYSDDAKNIAKQSEDAFTNTFKSAEDAIVQFSETGKLSIKSLGNTILNEWARINARQITGPLAQSLNSSIGSNSGLGGILNSLFKNIGGGGSSYAGFGGATGGANTLGFGGSYASGIDFVPYDQIAQIHQGEAVLTKEENAARKGGRGGAMNITINPPPGMSRQNANQFAAKVARQLAIADSRFN